MTQTIASEVGTSYDELPYDNRAFAASHPERLATVALLAGFEPPPIERCRVLELGCGSGGNLIPMAVPLPDAEFVGIDLSSRQVSDGRALASEVGVTNVRIECADIARLDVALGTFDYIICHGVYSWVPEPVQTRIFALCEELLSPRGLAYISYNVLPGWHLRSGLRELLLLHTTNGGSAESRVRRARQLIERLGSAGELDGTYSNVLAAIAKTLAPLSDTYVFHEYLESDNRPVYFRDFVARAAAHGLDWLGEATLATQEGRDAIRAAQFADSIAPEHADRVWRGQCADLLRGCAFRRSLLCRADAIRSSHSPEQAVYRLRAATRLRFASGIVPLETDETQTFETPAGVEASTNHPLLKAAFVAASEAWPASLTFDELWREIRSRLAGTAAGGSIDEQRDRPYVAQALVQAEASGLIDLHIHEPPICRTAGPLPVASRYARAQADRGEARLVNLRHLTVELGVFDLTLLPLLDGRRDRAALLDAITAQVRSGEIRIERDGRSLADDPAGIAAELPGAIEGGLTRIAGMALLTA